AASVSPIKPPFAERAKAATARSISPASRTLIAFTSTPSDGATVWMGELADPSRTGGVAKYSRSLHAGRDLLEQFQPFPAQTVFGSHEAGYVAARPGQSVDKATADRIAHRREHGRNAAACLLHRRQA